MASLKGFLSTENLLNIVGFVENSWKMFCRKSFVKAIPFIEVFWKKRGFRKQAEYLWKVLCLRKDCGMSYVHIGLVEVFSR